MLRHSGSFPWHPHRPVGLESFRVAESCHLCLGLFSKLFHVPLRLDTAHIHLADISLTEQAGIQKGRCKAIFAAMLAPDGGHPCIHCMLRRYQY